MISNMNEMMEEYVGVIGEEANLKLEILVVQEEMAEIRTKTEQQ